MQRAQPNDGPLHAGFHPYPLIHGPGEGEATGGLFMHQSDAYQEAVPFVLAGSRRTWGAVSAENPVLTRGARDLRVLRT